MERPEPTTNRWAPRPRVALALRVAAFVVPLAATVWVTTTLLDRSLQYATTGELDRLSRTLESTAKQFYQRERDALKEDALAGRSEATVYRAADVSRWPEAVRAGWAMRRGRWWAQPPFLPLPERDYVNWRAATAYGSEQTDATAQDLVSYLGWRKQLRRVGQ